MIKESTLSQEEMNRLIHTGYRCQCGSPLSVAWGGSFGYQGYILRCGRDIKHVNFERPVEMSLHTDCNMPGWKLSRERSMALEAKVGPDKKQALMKYEGVAALSTLEAKEIITTMWPGAEKASPAEVFKAITICHQYGLNPLVGHLHLIPFDKKDATGKVVGKTYAAVKGIGANRLIARRKHSFSYIDMTPRYMTEEEEKKVWKTVDPDKIRFIVTLKDTKTGATASGYGEWAKYKSVGGKKYLNNPKGIDKGNSVENMSGIRAERQALDRLYPADMPTSIPFEDELSERPVVEVEPASGSPEKSPVIDAETGEILEGEFTESQGDPGGIFVEENPEPVTAGAPVGTATAGAPPAAVMAPPAAKPPAASTVGTKQPTKKSAAPAPGTREYNIQMIRAAANKLKWDNKRLTDEMAKKYLGVISYDGLTDDELQDFASKLTDMAECA